MLLLHITFIPHRLGQCERLFSKLTDLFGGELEVGLSTEQFQMQDYVHLDIGGLRYTPEDWNSRHFTLYLDRLEERGLLEAWELLNAYGETVTRGGVSEDDEEEEEKKGN